MTKKTRDNLYEYIFITDLESTVARHPLFLRLHYIHQNSFTFLTYPTAHMQRHPHSLGVMHVAGLMFSKALLNTNNVQVLETLVSNINLEASEVKNCEYVNKNDVKKEGFSAVIEEFNEKRRNLFNNENIYSELVGTDGFLPTDTTRNEDELAICLLYQGIRLAALVHDIGHPPFSHIVEYGFQSSLSDGYHHEKVGYDLAEIVFDDILNPNSRYYRKSVADYANFYKCACHLAMNILTKKSSQLSGLKSTILAGDMDADRLDYVRRDIESTALTATSYDLGRILDSLHFRPSTKTVDKNQTEVGISPGALSAIETFFTARFHLYRWAIFHHDVARRNLCMHRFVHNFLKIEGLPKDLAKAQSEFQAIAQDKAKRRDYRFFTDGYFLKLLWDVYDWTDAHLDAITPDLRDLHLFCDLVLTRNNDRLKSLWKRPDHYAGFANTFYSGYSPDEHPVETVKTTVESNEIPVERLNREFRTIFDKLYAPKYGEKLGRFQFAIDFENLATAKIERPGHRLFVSYIAPFKAAPDRMILTERNSSTVTAVDDVSPTVASLKTAWNKSPQISVFYEVNQVNAGLAKPTLDDIYNKAIKDALEEMCNWESI